MKKYEKIFTDNPFIDELVYFTKTIAVNAVIKDSDKADANESIDSLKAADLYIACRENKARFEHFDFDYDFLVSTHILPPAIVEQCAKDNTRIPEKYRDKLLKLKIQESIIEYEETNDYYRMLMGLPNMADTDYIYLTEDDLSDIPELYDKYLLSIKSSQNNNINLDEETGITTIKLPYISKANNHNIINYIRFSLILTNEKNPIITINEEIDEEVGYTNLADMTSDDWKISSSINSSGKIISVQDTTSNVTNYIPYKNGNVVRIKNATLSEEYKFATYGSNPPVHTMNNEDLTILYSHEIIDNLVNEYPDKKYLKFMGDNAIDPYKARKALDFQILYIPTIYNNELMDRWNTKYEQNRMYTLKTYYSEAYKLYSDYYNNFIMVFIVLQTMIDIISEVQEFIARRDIFDDRSIRYLFESYGIPYYPEIPRVYQIAMVKNINTLLKWKASTKNMIDICSLFGFDDINIFRYYLLKDRRLVADMDNDKTNDDYQFHYKTIIDENGDKKVVDDNDNNYDLKFVRVPIEDKADDYLKDKTAYEDYDIITNQDEFWDGKSDHQDIKSAILDQEFSWVRTKYISIDTLYDLTEMCFDLPYFINIFVDDWLKEDYLYVNIPTIKNNHKFRVADLFVYMMSITHLYHGFKDLVMVDRSKILSILGFNFHVDMHELGNDIYETTTMEINEMGTDYFYIPAKQITNFDYLLQLFTKNKEIWRTVNNGMFHADNKRVYTAYKKVYDACYISEYNTKFFELDGEPLPESNHKTGEGYTYTEFLKERDYVLYESIKDLESYTDETSLRKTISDIIIEIVYVLEEYMDSDEFKYIFSKFPAVSGDYVRSYMLKVVNFFKSYKVHLLNISTVYKAFDKGTNAFKVYDDWITEVKKEPGDYAQIIEEITADISLNKSDKVKLLEKMYFEIERWEFRDYDEIIAIKDKIAAILNEMTYSDSVNVIDHYKGFPFAGIDYEYEKDDKVSMIESIDPEVENTIWSKCNILDRIKISYED